MFMNFTSYNPNHGIDDNNELRMSFTYTSEANRANVGEDTISFFG